MYERKSVGEKRGRYQGEVGKRGHIKKVWGESKGGGVNKERKRG